MGAVLTGNITNRMPGLAKIPGEEASEEQAANAPMGTLLTRNITNRMPGLAKIPGKEVGEEQAANGVIAYKKYNQ